MAEIEETSYRQAVGLHVGIIMDGNGRWARARGKPRVMGHRAGARRVRDIVESAPDYGIGTLTLYAFSSDNWRRPQREVSALMRLFRSYIASETARCVQNGVRLNIIGRRDRLPPELLASIESGEAETSGGDTLELRVAIDYSSRDLIARAAAALAGRGCEPDERGAFERELARAYNAVSLPEVDLLIRTGGEQRLSDFLLWECAYAELYFSERMWPDFSPAELQSAVAEFHSRERRFGMVPQAAAG